MSSAYVQQNWENGRGGARRERRLDLITKIPKFWTFSYSGTTWTQYLCGGPVNGVFDMQMNKCGAVEMKHVFVFLFLSFFVRFWRGSPQWARISSFTRFLDHTRCTIVGRTPLDEWSALRRDHYLTAHNTHNRQTSMPPVEFEPTISAGERPLVPEETHVGYRIFDSSVTVMERSWAWSLGDRSSIL